MKIFIHTKFFLSITITLSFVFVTTTHAKWKFGLHGDTQWTATESGNDTNGVPGSIITQVNAEFIRHGVKFVIETGDLSDKGGRVPLQRRALAAQDLYNANIGFYPMRGNHDYDWLYSTSYGINGFHEAFPQTFGERHPGVNLYGAYNFTSPPPFAPTLDTILNGMSYSFDYGTDNDDARFVIVDVFGTATKATSSRVTAGIRYGYSVGDQNNWISDRLDINNPNRPAHVFVLGHQNLIGEIHANCLFSGYANDNIDMQNTFFSCLQNNGVRYYIGGHEHIFNRAIVASPNGLSKVQNITNCASSTKFYEPKQPDNVDFKGQKYRQTQVAQETHHIGYTICTVDGPRVNFDYYSDNFGNWQEDNAWPDGSGSRITPPITFVKKQSWGYGLNGKEFMISNNQSYTSVVDMFQGTTAKILSGVNDCMSTDFEGRPLTKLITTGWGGEKCDALFRSELLTLWGMADFGSPEETDIYTLQLSYNPSTTGACAIMSQNDDGTWTNAIVKNIGGTKKFIAGPFKNSYTTPGMYGIDFASKTVWAVINHPGTFAVRVSSDGDQDGDGDVDDDDVAIVVAHRGFTSAEFPASDLDYDGKITVLDARKAVLLKTVN